MDNQKFVLYICHDRVKVAGAALSLLNLLDSISYTDYKAIVLVRKGIVKDLFVKHGYECITFPYQLTLSRKSNLIIRIFRQMVDRFINHICVLFVHWKLRKNRISIVHSNSTATDVGYYIAKKLRAKHVWHLREFLDLDFNTSPSKGWEDLYSKIFNSDFVIAITQNIYSHWHLEKCSHTKIMFDAVRSENEIVNIQQKDNYFVFCAATLGDGKGADVAVKIFCKSYLYKEGYRLMMIGSYTPDYKKKLDLIAEQFNQLDFIDYLGFQDDIKPFFIKASAFLMCSVKEALGRVTIEAFFYGCPVLGHNTGGTSELIDDGVNGYLYDNEEEGVRKLRMLVENKDKTLAVVNRATMYAKENFTIEGYGTKMCNIYNSIL